MENDIKVEVAVLNSVVFKIDNTVAEMAKSTADICKILAVHNTRLLSLEDDHKETNTDVRDLYNNMNNNTKEILNKIDDMNNKIDNKLKIHTDKSSEQHRIITERLNTLENWRWMIVGISVALGFFLKHLDIFKSV
tara:strand:+ start:689 stop:1096 length:408 start_codon:yes stop_codon:yes gene_type:complete